MSLMNPLAGIPNPDARIDHNKTVWQRCEEALIAATGGDKKATAELLPELHMLVVRERRDAARG